MSDIQNIIDKANEKEKKFIDELSIELGKDLIGKKVMRKRSRQSFSPQAEIETIVGCSYSNHNIYVRTNKSSAFLLELYRFID
jgi:hypothetical protein